MLMIAFSIIMSSSGESLKSIIIILYCVKSIISYCVKSCKSRDLERESRLEIYSKFHILVNSSPSRTGRQQRNVLHVIYECGCIWDIVTAGPLIRVGFERKICMRMHGTFHQRTRYIIFTEFYSYVFCLQLA